MNWLNMCINAALEYNEIKEAMGLSNAGFRSKRTQGGQPMITDKEKARQTLKKILLAVEPFSDEPALTLFCEALIEYAEQARKEAAERFCASCHGKEDGMCGECPDRAVILGETVKEGKTDAEKLAIAVNALERAGISIAKTDGDYDTLCVIRHALKEIQ